MKRTENGQKRISARTLHGLDSAKRNSDAADARWLNGAHQRLHKDFLAPMPGACVICRVFARLAEEKKINKKLRRALQAIGVKAENLAWCDGGNPR